MNNKFLEQFLINPKTKNKMKKITAILSIAILFSCNNSKNESTTNTVNDAAKDKAAEMTDGATNSTATAPSGYKKYDLKSGIITFETTGSVSGDQLPKTKQILYFDDYGAKESQETYKIDEATGKEILTDRDFEKDGFRYIISFEHKGGSKTKGSGYGIASPFVMSEAASQKAKGLADETIAGKPCKGFAMVTPSGNITTYGWNKITLKTITDNTEYKIKSKTVATKIEENVSIPADKFEVPAGMEMTNM